MGLPSPFFSNGLSPAQSKVEMNLKHLGTLQPNFFSNGLSPAQSKVEMNLKHLGALQPFFFSKWALSSPV